MNKTYEYAYLAFENKGVGGSWYLNDKLYIREQLPSHEALNLVGKDGWKVIEVSEDTGYLMVREL